MQEITLTKDVSHEIDFVNLSDVEKEMFIKDLRYLVFGMMGNPLVKEITITPWKKIEEVKEIEVDHVI